MQQMNQADHLPIICKEDVFEGNAIRFSKMTTLQHMAAVRVASHLWTTKYIKDKAPQVFESNGENNLKSSCLNLSLLLEDKVRKLPIPDRLISCLTDVVNRLGIEVLRWLKFHKNFNPLFKSWKYFHHIQWTARGRIDERETAKLIVSEDDVNDDFRANASKFYCLDSNGEITAEIVAYWNMILFNKWANEFEDMGYNKIRAYLPILATTAQSMPDNYDGLHQLFLNEGESFEHMGYDTIRATTARSIPDSYEEFHQLFINEEGERVVESDLYHLNKLIKYSDDTVLRHWWATFDKERKSYFLKGFDISRSADVMCFLLSQMNEELQAYFLRKYSLYVLWILFTDWLWQDYFMPTLLHLFHEIDSDAFVKLLRGVTFVMKSGLQSRRCKALLLEMLQRTPHHLKLEISSYWKSRMKTLINVVLVPLYELEYMDIIKQLLSIITFNKEKDFLYDLTSSLILQFTSFNVDKLSLLEISAGYLFMTKEDLEKHFLRGNRFLLLFKKLLYRRNFVLLEKLINILAHNEAKIGSFKQKFLKITHFVSLLTRSALGNRYEDVDETLTFCLSGDDQMIKHFKRTHLSAVDSFMLCDLINDVNMPMSLEKFLCYCYGNAEGISVFRNELLQDTSKLTSACCKVWYYEGLESIDKCLDWCFTSDKEKVELFKIEFARSPELRIRSVLIDSVCKAEKFVRWLNPTLKVIHQLKRNLQVDVNTVFYIANYKLYLMNALSQEETRLRCSMNNAG